MYTKYKPFNFQKNGKPCIYMIKNNINNKVYIGSASGHYRRKGQHYYMLRRNIHFNKHLQSSWNKYKEDSFVFEIIEFINDMSIITIREEYYIKLYNAINNKYGYNHNPNCTNTFGMKWSDEARLRFSKLKKGKPILHIDYKQQALINMKKIYGINKTTKELVYFNSIKEAGLFINKDRTNISKALHGIIKSTGNHYWYFCDLDEQSSLNNSVNSGNIHKLDNPDLNSMNDNIVIEKEQRLTSEESTNNLDTSAEQPKIG